MRFFLRALGGIIFALLGFAVVVGSIAMVVFAVLGQEPPDTSTAEEREWPVELVTLATKDVQPKIQVFGRVKAARELSIRSNGGGEVLAIGETFGEGAAVTAGDLLVQFDDFDSRAALNEAQIARAEASARTKQLELDVLNQNIGLESAASQLKLAEENARRQRGLYDQGTVSRAAVEQAQDALLAAQAGLDARKLSIQAAQATLEAQALSVQRADLAIERANKHLADTRITAPFDGRLLDVNALVGEIVPPGSLLAILIGNDHFELTFELSDQQLSRFDPLNAQTALIGRIFEFYWYQGDKRRVGRGEVFRVDERVSQSTGGVQVTGRIFGVGLPEGLRQNALVEVDLPEPTLTNVLALPPSAISEAKKIFKPGADNRLDEVAVEVLRRTGNEVIIKDDTLVGQAIVSRRYAQLANDVLVEEFDPNQPLVEPETDGDPDSEAQSDVEERAQ